MKNSELKMKLKKYLIPISEKDISKMDELAKEKEASRSYLIRCAIKNFLKKELQNARE